ncbi:MAG TPA: NAD(P)-dependent oxidoreductase, partial [Gammaproteobacteria bacterium]|nr:NAD(P)-dependent oxidoreductase [Gammaproteobacteria bacterium]
MRIFLTGATGFLGSYIAREALNRRHDVAVLIRTHANLWRISDIIENLKVIYGTLEEQQAWQQQIHNFAPDAIIHAAWHGVENKSHSSDDQLSNIPALKFLLALATACGCKKFIGIGSQAEYGL